MSLTIGIASVTVVAMTLTVLIKPYAQIKNLKIGLYWVVCLIGAVLMLATNRLSISSAISGITADTSVNPIKILLLFLSMTLLSVYLGDAGFFDYLANRIFLKTKGGKLKLFLVLYAVVSILTVFTSNDVIILTFTPPICIFAKKAKISPIPFLLGEFVAANTWSMAFIIGNPTNVYLAGSAGISFLEYFSVMFLPTIVGGITSLAVLLVLFMKDLKSPVPENREFDKSQTHGTVKHLAPLVVALVHLFVCIFLLAISDFIKVEMWIICVLLALSLTVFDLIYDITVEKTVIPVVRSLRKEPYELIPFVLSMFIIVLAWKENGVTDLISSFIVSGENKDAISVGFLSAFSANFLNNIPMSVLFESIIGGKSLPALYGAVIGSNIGAFITPVGALAGIMWNKILVRYGVKLSFAKFVLYGVAVAIPTLTTTLLTLFLVL
ncbi:MAG: hypothetical protein J6U92_04875 [Clostridia bacterium]|nr:hypothetical protein [Clostridia bacterium]